MDSEGRKIVFLILLEIPLLIALFFSVKSFIFHNYKIKVLDDIDTDIKKERLKLLLLSLTILLIIILQVVLFILPSMALALVFMVFIYTILGFLYSFLGLFYGLGKVKEAGGSPAEVLITLSSYLRDYFNINKPKEPFKNDLLKQDEKDAQTKLDHHKS